MHAVSPKRGLVPLTPYEPAKHGGPPMRLAAPAGQLSLDDLLTELSARQAPGDALPMLERRKVHRVITALLEVHSGRRPAAQLGRWLSPALHRTLRNRVRTSGPRYTLRKVHTSRPADDAIEACGIAQSGERALAVTARFEHQESRWSCTYFTVLEPGAGPAR